MDNRGVAFYLPDYAGIPGNEPERIWNTFSIPPPKVREFRQSRFTPLGREIALVAISAGVLCQLNYPTRGLLTREKTRRTKPTKVDRSARPGNNRSSACTPRSTFPRYRRFCRVIRDCGIANVCGYFAERINHFRV